MTRFLCLLCAVPLLLTAACGKKPSAPETKPVVAGAPSARAKVKPGARVFIVEPADRARATSPVTVKFGAEGVDVEKAGEVKDGSGHHHLLVDYVGLPPADQPLPFDQSVLHFGQGQTEASINLTPGLHTLQLVFAGGNHVPTDPVLVSEKITISVPVP